MNFLRAMFLILAALPLAACALSGEEMNGRVLEEGTNKPISGAIVVVRWIGSTTSGGMFVESSTACYHVETTTTDAQGNYQTKPWRQPQHKDYTVKFDRIGVDAYKPGYGFPSKLSQVQEIEYLAPFKGPREERLAYLLRTSNSIQCNEAGESIRKTLPLQQTIYDEAKSIAQTPEDQKRVEILLFGLESMEYGSMEALKRMTERRSAGQ